MASGGRLLARPSGAESGGWWPRLLVLLWLLGLGCAVAPIGGAFVPTGEQEAAFPAPYDDVFEATRRAFKEAAGFNLVVIDKQAGRLETAVAHSFKDPATGKEFAPPPPGGAHANRTWELRAKLTKVDANHTKLVLRVRKEQQLGYGRWTGVGPEPQLFDVFFDYIGQTAGQVGVAAGAPAPLAVGAPPKPAVAAYMLGLVVRPLSPELAGVLKLEGGLFVMEVAEDSPAAEAGLRPLDVITAFGTLTADSHAVLSQVVEALDIGAAVEVKIIREGRPRTLTLRPDHTR